METALSPYGLPDTDDMTNPGSVRTIGSRAFTAGEQEVFASASADRNPMHMDAVAARRLLTGRPVVHGAHVLITALLLCSRHVPVRLSGLKCSFDNPISIGDRVDFVLDSTSPEEVRIEAIVKDMRCAHVSWPRTPRNSSEDAVDNGTTDTTELMPTLAAPLALPPQEHVGRTYTVRCLQDEAVAALPEACAALGAPNIAAICSLSYCVGMICPGLNSIFAAIDIESTDDGAAYDAVSFHVEKYDDRVRLFVISFDGALRGRLRAFLRPEPAPQPSYTDVAARVGAEEFSGTKCLIVGGSRGLGELTAKVLAAGGAHVDVTYAAGGADARRVCDEINAHRPGKAQATVWDVHSTGVENIAVDWTALNAVYYFATPRIFRKKLGVFHTELHREFVEFYVEKFCRLCEYLELHTAQSTVRVFLPSTVYVTERPRGLAEYAMAKAAAEVLAHEINRSFKRVRIHCSRLPRFDTDQTASIIKQRPSPALDFILDVIRGTHALS